MKKNQLTMWTTTKLDTIQKTLDVSTHSCMRIRQKNTVKTAEASYWVEKERDDDYTNRH